MEARYHGIFSFNTLSYLQSIHFIYEMTNQHSIFRAMVGVDFGCSGKAGGVDYGCSGEAAGVDSGCSEESF